MNKKLEDFLNIGLMSHRIKLKKIISVMPKQKNKLFASLLMVLIN